MENKWLIWVLIINAVLALIYFIYRGFIKKEYRKAFLLVTFILFVPAVGVLFLVFSELLNTVLFRKRDGMLNEDELSFNKKRARMIISDDLEKEADRVPLEEALIISDTFNRRQSFLDVLKRPDVESYMSGIQTALTQEDAEIVHYAASYITDTIAKYKDTEKRLRDLCEKSSDTGTLLIYLQFCDTMLQKKIFSEPEQYNYLAFFESYMEKLYQEDSTCVKGHMLEDIIGFWLERDDVAHVEKWVERAKEFIESDIYAAKEVLKYYFRMKNDEKFKQTVSQIKESPLILDGELLEWVRFYG